MFTKSTCVLLAATAGAALLAGCERQKPAVVQYDVPKLPRAEGVADLTASPMKTGATPAATPAASGATMANTAVPVAQGEATWTVPSGWKEDPKPMRKGSWIAGACEVSVTAFPGSVGTLAQNIARWCGQVKLPEPASEDAVLALAKPVRLDGLDARRVELAGASALTVVLVERDGAQWFFKISGPAADVKAHAAEFDAFLASVKFPAAK